jgi:hypothetical protein
MLGLSANMNTLIDMNYFNNALIMGGGNEIISSKKDLVTMRRFIKILLKLFKKDYDKKKLYSSRSGGSANYTEYSHAYNFSDLSYSNPYPFPLAAAVDRSFT